MEGLDRELRPLAAPKLLTEAKSVQVVWARVKGYPPWPAQVLSESAASRRKDLSLERHSKDSSVPVMFFGTVEVAWVKEPDVIDFKEGVHKGYFAKKMPAFRLALEQVCEFLALDRKRKAPPKWWCKPPTNGLEEQSDGPQPKSGSAAGSGAGKGTQRQEAVKSSRQRAATPDSESAESSDAESSSEEDASSSAEEDEPSAPIGGKKSTGKPAAAKPKELAAPAAKLRDVSASRLTRDTSAAAASSSHAKRPQPAAGPAKQQAQASYDTKASRQAAQQQNGAKSGTAPSRESDATVPPRKRLKVEAQPAGLTGAGGRLPPLPSAAGKAVAAHAGGMAGKEGAGDVDAAKLPAEIRRLAGIRLTMPKKPAATREESPRRRADGPAAASTVAVKREDSGAEAGPGRSSRAGREAARRGEAARSSGAGKDVDKRSQRSRKATDEESQSASASDEDDEQDEEAQSSGEEGDSEEGGGSEEDSDESSESEESEDEEVAAVARRASKDAASTPVRLTRSQRRRQPSRDRRGEKQRRLARLAAPRTMDRRTSSRLVTKPADGEEGGSGNDEEGSEAGSEEDDEEDGKDEASSSGSDAETAAAPAKGSDRADFAGRKLRSQTLSPGAAARPHSSRKPLAASPLGPSPASDKARKPQAAVSTDTEGEAEDAEVRKPPQQFKRASAAGAAAGGTASGVSPSKAVPLELRRLQADLSAAPPVVDTTERRTLRDRPSPAGRLPACGSAGPTPTQTGVTAVAVGSKQADKRSSDDGSEASMSPEAECAGVLERASSPDPRREGSQQGGAALEGSRPAAARHGRAPEGRNSKAGSAAGSASPPPGPASGGVPVKKKPPSLGVPSAARAAGQGCVRQLPAILPVPAVMRSLSVKRELVQATPAASAAVSGSSAAAGTSTAGAVPPAPAVVMVKKPSSWPPTRQAVDRAIDAAPVSSTDLPDAASAEGEADVRHASSPDVAAAAAVVAAGAGQVPRSPGEAPAEEEELQAVVDAADELDTVEGGEELLPPAEQQKQQQQPQQEVQDVEQEQPHDEPMLEAEPNAQEAAAPVPKQEEEEQEEEHEEQLEVGPQAMDVDALQPAEASCHRGLGASPAGSGCQQVKGSQELQAPPHGASDAERPLPADAQEPHPSTSRSSAQHGHAQQQAQQQAQQRQQQHPSSSQPAPEVEVQRRLGSRPSSPVHDEVLLAEEQLPDHAEDVKTQLGDGSAAMRLLTLSAGGLDVVASAAAARQTSGSGGSAKAVALRSGGDGESSSDGGAAEARASGGDVSDDDEAARAQARELEELGEVAAALAGLQRAEVPRPQGHVRGPVAPPAAVATATDFGVREALLDQSRGQHRSMRGVTSGRDRGGGSSREQSAAQVQYAPEAHDFTWPQAEPLLPAQEQSFALPREWLATRPPRYEGLRRNLWLSRNKPKRLPKDEVNTCACRPPPMAAPGEQQRLGCGMNCLNRVSFVLCDPKLCPCGDLCSNRSLHLLRPPKTEVFATENRGWGVRAMEPVPKGGFIIEYAGEVIDERELGRRMDHARMNAEQHFYIMELSAGLYIDARRKGNTARLINSSCDPNCETQKWHDAATGEVRVGIYATRDIGPGEELEYDYFFSTYGSLKPSAASFLCMCGAKNCRGTMDAHPEKRRDLGRRVEVFWDADAQYYRAVIVAYHPTSRKHTVMYEDGGTEKLLLDEVPHRWMDDDKQPSPAKRASQTGTSPGGGAGADVAGVRPGASPAQGSTGGAAGAAAAEAAPPSGAAGNRYVASVPAPAVVVQPPPRAVVTTEHRCTLPPLGSAAVAAEAATVSGALPSSKHVLQEHELHLPLKKRPRMMQSLGQQPQQQQQQSSTPAERVGTSGGGADAGGGPSTGPTAGIASHSGAGADGASGEGKGYGGRGGGASSRYESTGGAAAAAAAAASATEEETNEDLDSLLEAAEAVAALRTAPIGGNVPSTTSSQDAAPSRYGRGGPGSSSAFVNAGHGGVSMVQTVKVASPRHLVAHRSGPPNGLPPTSRPGLASSSSAGPSQQNHHHHYHQAGMKQPHSTPQEAHSEYEYHRDHREHHRERRREQQREHEFNGRSSSRAIAEPESSAGGPAGGANGYASNAGGGTNGNGINREDLLWRLVGIERPKDLLPLFAGGEKKNGEAKNGNGGCSWIGPSHPYGRLLRALESSELLPHADQLRIYAQQHSQAQLQQQQQQQHAHHHQQQQHHHHQHAPAQQAQVHPQQQQQHQQQQPSSTTSATQAAAQHPHMHAQQQQQQQQQQQHQHKHQHKHQQQQHAHHQPVAHQAQHTHHQPAAATATAVESLALSAAWQHAAQHQALMHAHHQQQQHAAAAAAAMAAQASQLHHLHAHAHAGGHHAAAAAAQQQAPHVHAAAAAAVAAAVGVPTQQLAAAAQWQHAAAQAQQGQIIQDLVHMYAHAPHQVLAMAATAAAGGPPLRGA